VPNCHSDGAKLAPNIYNKNNILILIREKTFQKGLKDIRVGLEIGLGVTTERPEISNKKLS